MYEWFIKWFEPSIIVTLIAAVVAIWYTYETQKLRRVAALQLDVMKQQATVAQSTASQALNAAFLELFPIIEKHHSPAVAEYRRFARNKLPKICAAARAANKKLETFDPAAAKMASDIANYYESLGMLIEHGDGKLIPDVERMLIDMVQSSAHDIWEIFHDNIDVIHREPENLGMWAGSFERLYFRIAKFNEKLPATRNILPRG
jgi:hypothetical protein